MTLISDKVVETRRPRAPRAPVGAELGRVLGTGATPSYVKFRSEMFRNSSEKSSISEASAFVFDVKWL